MRSMVALLALGCLSVTQDVPSPAWTTLDTGVTVRLRGLSSAGRDVVWASGAGGTVLRSTDAGSTWQKLTMPARAETLDFRDVDAVDERTAYLLSIGPGSQSRIYKTADAGKSWTEQFVNRDEKAFFDAMSFWDPARGLAFSDSVDGQFVVIATGDGGRTWSRIPATQLPPALDNEGAFAASGSNIAVAGSEHAWIGTGAAAVGRVLRTADGGGTWSASSTPLSSGTSSGIFSVAFRDIRHGIVVGGDYRREGAAGDNAAITTDGGESWTAVTGLTGFRSAVAFHPRRRDIVVAVGPSGTDVSTDRGRTWRPIRGPGYDALTFLADGRAIGVGADGRAGRLTGL